MNKQKQIEALKAKLADLNEQAEQAQYGIALSLKTKEYDRLLNCAQRMVIIDACRADLLIELAALQENIDDDSGGTH